MAKANKWIEKFLYALDDSEEIEFLEGNANQIPIGVYHEILVHYITAVHECGSTVEERVQDYIRDELGIMATNLEE